MCSSDLLGAGTSAFTTLTGGTVGYVATWNGSTWVASAPTTAGVTSFNGRSGAVTPQSSDYSSYYAYTDGSNASGTWGINISGTAATATNATTASYINNASSNGYGTRTISTSAPSGGNNGDVWYKY